ncbi:MAG: D-alanyl-D-alanine carboxypeptidase/D-alanyl-D-alanine-endopeptidase [Sedimentisphaerales bacterium]|nr:D-alanyl-D-alanine carboxypeptidase/D-alanyl-D-alanine-endopeptidase [Sedimentisphaerales bacterium]
MKNQTEQLFIAVLLSIFFAVGAQADLAKRIDAILARPANLKVHFSIHVIKAATAGTVYQNRAGELMIPASNMKLVTTAAALHYLGSDFEYKTRVGLCGDTLVVIGSGDPLLGDPIIDAKYNRKTGWIFEDIVRVLKRKGISLVRDIVVDTSVFDDQRVHPNWPVDQLNRWYAAEVSGLNYNDNCVNIIASNAAGRITILVEPQTAFLNIINNITPVSKGGSAIGAYRNRHPNKITLKGKCQTQATISDLAIERPAAFFGFMLAENLARAGIKPQGRVVEKNIAEDCDFKLLAEYTTPISDCLERSNKRSLGLVAEALMKTIAAHSTQDKKNGGWKTGQELVGKYLSDIGVDKSQFFIDDGSGLSRVNELTASAITKVLINLYRSEKWNMYRESLAVGGVDGTIADHFYRSEYKGRILGKTGYIDGVRALSGICTTKKGDFIFSILANDANGLTRLAINDIAKAIIDDVESDLPRKAPATWYPERN